METIPSESADRSGIKLYQCEHCGFQEPLVAKFAPIFSWHWKAMFNVLHGDLPKNTCARCKEKNNLPIFIAFVSEETDTAVVLVETDVAPELSDEIMMVLQAKGISEPENSLIRNPEELKKAIQNHILNFKLLLTEISSAMQKDGLHAFLDERWREIGPNVLAALFMAKFGFIPGLGAAILDRETGKPMEPTQQMAVLEDIVASIQFNVWAKLSASKMTPENPLEDLLDEHIKSGALYGNAIAHFQILVEKYEVALDKKEIQFTTYYSALALFASAANLAGKDNVLEKSWTHAYFQLESFPKANEILGAWKVDPKRAGQTISIKSAWNFLAYRFQKTLEHSYPQKETMEGALKDLGILDEITERIGYKDLASQVFRSIRIVGDSPDDEKGGTNKIRSEAIEAAVEKIFQVVQKNPKIMLGSALRSFSGPIAGIADPEMLERIFDKGMKHARSKEEQASLECWLGECSKLMRNANLFIRKVGLERRSWELDMSLRWRVSLDNERANALRLLNNQSLALALTDDLIKLVKGNPDCEDQRFILAKNRAILLRESGSPDTAAVEMKALLKIAPLDEKAQLLESYAGTLSLLKRTDESVVALREALEFAGPSGKGYEYRLKGVLAQAYSAIGKVDEALALLKETTFDATDAVSPRAGAYLNLIVHEVALSDEHLEIAEKLIRIILGSIDSAIEAGDFHLAAQNSQLAAQLADESDIDGAEQLLEMHRDLHKRHFGGESADILIRLAVRKLAAGKLAEARIFSNLLPVNLAEKFGAVQDVWMGYDTTWNAQVGLNRLLNAAMKREISWPEIRFLAELKRDVIGRAKLVKADPSYPDALGRMEDVAPEAILRLFSRHPHLAVLEWVRTDKFIFCLLTRISDGNILRTVPIELPNLNFTDTRDRIMHLLSVWHSDRAGDPFEHPSWIGLESAFREKLAPILPPETHIAVIEEEALVGIPWHVVFANSWTCSYAPSWTALLGSSLAISHTYDRLGIFSAPRMSDSNSIVAALSQGVETIGGIGREKGLDIRVKSDVNADRAGFESLMRECDFLFLLCHGYVHPGSHEIALIISNNGALPPLHAPGDPDVPDPNRISWRDMQSLGKAAPVVLSVACSSGLNWRAGAGEPMGLYGALRHKGTTCLVAPRWDVVAEDVIPILGNILRRRLNGERLASAVRKASQDAETTLPKWLAWSISLEGGLI